MTGARGANGLGFTVALADVELNRLRRLFPLLAENTPAITEVWHELIVRHQVTGLAVYDARLAATVVHTASIRS